MAIFRVSSKAISSCTRSISSTRSSQKVKIDKETCKKVIEAAETVKDGTKQVVQEVKRIGQVITDKVTNAMGYMMADVAEKGIEKAADTTKSQRSKDVLDTAKVATEALKNKVVDDK